MKYITTGLHSSGKQEIITELVRLNIKCGKLFSNIDNPSNKFMVGNIGATTLGNLPSTKPINLSQESNKQENLGNLDWIPYAQQKGYIK